MRLVNDMEWPTPGRKAGLCRLREGRYVGQGGHAGGRSKTPTIGGAAPLVRYHSARICAGAAISGTSLSLFTLQQAQGERIYVVQPSDFPCVVGLPNHGRKILLIRFFLNDLELC